MTEIFIPESADWQSHNDYYGQIEWEWNALDRASVIVFWVPRDMEIFPGLTTNVEFGKYIAEQKVILGYPINAPKMKYLDSLAKKFNVSVFHTLKDTLSEAVKRA